MEKPALKQVFLFDLLNEHELEARAINTLFEFIFK